MKTGRERLWFRLSALAVAGILVLIPVLVSLCSTGEIVGANVYASERIEGGDNAEDGTTSAAEIFPGGSTSGSSSPGEKQPGETSGGDGSSAGSKEEGETSGGGGTSSAVGVTGDSGSGDGRTVDSGSGNEQSGEMSGGGSSAGSKEEGEAGGDGAPSASEGSSGGSGTGDSRLVDSGSGDEQSGETSGRGGSSTAAKDKGGEAGGSGRIPGSGSSDSGSSDSGSSDSGSSDNSSGEKTGGSSSRPERSPGEGSASGGKGNDTQKETDTQQGNDTQKGADTQKGTNRQDDGSSAAGTGASAQSEDQAASVPGEVLEEEWMTVGEFENAFESVTEGAAGAAATLSDARIVSKRSELDYEELGLGEDMAGIVNHTTPIDVEDGDGNGYYGVCVVPNDRGWPKGTVLPNVKRVTDAVMIKLYYYTVFDNYGKQLASSRGYGGRAEEVAVCACHEAMSRRYSELAGVEYYRPNLDNDFESLVSAYYRGASSKAVPDPDKVLIYICARAQNDGHWMQAYIFGRIEEEQAASIVLMKTCSDPDMRPRYTAYSLTETAEGKEVVFRLFSDKECTRQVKVYKDAEMTEELPSIPVGADGSSGLTYRTNFYCEPGTYYVKEMNVPMGYQPHPEPFGPFTFEEGKGRTIRLSNTPRYGMAAVLKKDAKTGKGLEGAVFNMYSSKEDARNNAEPEGRFVTGENGRSNTLPVILGKGYYVREVKAPKGYELSTEIRLLKAADTFIHISWTEISNEFQQGRVRVKKMSADPEAAGSPYSLEGAEYTLYDSAGKEAGTLKTGKDGISNELTVPCGKYTLKETKASPGFELDVKTHDLSVTADKLTTVDSTEPPQKGRIRVKKISADPEAEGGPYSLEGAEYTLYDSDGKSAGKLKTGKDGISNELTVLCGKYTLKETKASPGFELDIKTHDLTVTADKLTTAESTEIPKKGKITLVKYSSEEKEKKEADTMPIAGAVYSLYKTKEDAEEMRSAAGTFVVQEDGTANVIEVLAGKTWFIRETKTPEGYLPDEQIHEAKVVSFTEVVTVRSEDKLIFGGVKACKLDLETNEGSPLGGAVLEGAVFRIFNDGDRSVYAGGRKVLPGAEALTLETDDKGVILTDPRALSYGTYRIEEVSPPDGYTMKGAKAVRFSIREDGAVVDLTGNKDTSIRNQIMRGDFSIRKLDSYTQRKMAGVTFEVTALDSEGKEIEKHRFTTDRNGFFDSTAVWAYAQKNIKNPISAGEPAGSEGGAAESGAAESGTAEGGSAQSGRIWFGAGTKPSDSMGALPYGDYLIEEIEGENNRGRKMFSDRFSVYADKQMIMLGNIENTLKPVLGTELEDEDGDHYADKNGIVTLTDTVAYGGMEEYIGKEIVFHGVIYVKETGQPLVIGGHKIEAVKTKKILSPAGTVKLRFTFDASKAKGMTLVCFEYASELPGETDPGSGPDQGENPDQASEGGTGQTADESGDQSSEGETGQTPGGPGDQSSQGGTAETGTQETNPEEDYYDSTNGGKDIASHTDPEDEAQTVRLVSVETDAEDKLTGTRTGLAREGAVTVDHVTCKGLIPGYYYLVSGILVDKSVGHPLKDAAGKEIEAHASFRAEKEEQTLDLTFTYDASALEGTTVVAFEKLYFKGKEKPHSPDDPNEPDHPDSPDNPDDPDHPDEPDNPDDPGQDNPIAVHEDPDDEDQSIHFPSIRTFASAKDGETKTFTIGEKLVLQDRVIWKNLIPGKTYSLRGSLMRKDNGKAFEADGRAVTAQTSFTPERSDGETILDFTFDSSSLAAVEDKNSNASTGNTASAESLSLRVVAFEELYLLPSEEDGGPDDQTEDSPDDPAPGTGGGPDPEEEQLVAEHKDLEDPAQTVLLKEPEEPEKPGKPEKPEEPEKPEKPEEPGKPEEPEKPRETEKTKVTEKEKEYEKTTTVKKEKEKTETGSSRRKVTPASPETVKVSGSPRTGDESNMALFAAVMILAAGAVAFLLRSGMFPKKPGKDRGSDSDDR